MKCKELEEVYHKHSSVHVPQSFQNNSDSEEMEKDPEEGPEKDPEEGPEEDIEEEPEEGLEEDSEVGIEESPKEQTQGKLIEGSKVELEVDQKEDSSEEQDEILAVDCAAPFKSSDEMSSAEQQTEHEDHDPSAECLLEPTETAYQNFSDEKQTIIVNTSDPSLSQNYGLEKNHNYDGTLKKEFNIKYTDQHSVPGGIEAVYGEENSGKQANSGKQRRSRWDQDPEGDQKTVTEDGKCKKRKTRWDADDSKSRSLPDWEVLALKKRYLELSGIPDSLVDNKPGIEVYPPEMMSCNKVSQEREKIFLNLANRNAIFCKELYIPVKEYPTYNFIGLILGPKGNTQKRMEVESGAKIRLRGKGSSKSAHEGDPSNNKDLHVRIEAVTQKSLDAAVCMVEKLLIPVEEGANAHKRAQLQELGSLKAAAIINACSVCKETGHNHFACPLKNSTLKAACDTCGSFSHPASGCPVTPFNLKIKNSKEISAAKLYVGFLPQTVNDSRLRELFSPFGTITDSVVIIDQKTGCSKGYGFLRFDTPSAASLAIMHMNGYLMDGHRLAVRIAGNSPTTGSPTPSLLPVYPTHRPAAVATSFPALPHYMMPEAQGSVLNGEGLCSPSSLNMEYRDQFSQTSVPFIPQRVSESMGLRTDFSSTGLVSRSAESRTPFLSTGLVLGSFESRTANLSAGLVSGSTESRSAFSSTGLDSVFPGNPDFPGLFSGSSESSTALSSAGFVPGSTESRNAFSSTSVVSMFPGDPDYPGSGFESYFP